MKKLFIMRHAKSEWKDHIGRDFDRTITPEGILETESVSNEFTKNKLTFDLIYLSPSNRTKQTLNVLNNFIKKKKIKVIEDMNLYDGCLESFLLKLKYINNELNNILIITHEPMIVDLVGFFIKEIDLAPENTFPKQYFNSSVICLNFQVESWENISNINCSFYKYIKPKNNYS